MLFKEEMSYQEEIKRLKTRIAILEERVKKLENKLNKEDNFNLIDHSIK